MFENLIKRFKDPNNPSLGANIIYLKLFLIWIADRTLIKTIIYYIFHVYCIVFVFSLFFNLIWKREYESFITLIHYSSLSLGVLKIYLFKKQYVRWERVIGVISEIEHDTSENNEEYKQILANYQRYSQKISFGFWGFGYICFGVFMTGYWIGCAIWYRQSHSTLKIFDAYFPFDDTSTLGHYGSVVLQTLFAVTSVAYVLCWDAMVLSAMMFFSGQFKALRVRCAHALDSKNEKESLWKLHKCHEIYIKLLE